MLSEKRSGIIPAEDDWYAPLIGDWIFDYHEPGGRHLKGEWFFRRVLEGTAIGDIFICPSRDTKETTFHWKNITVMENGEYKVNCEVFAQRRGKLQEKPDAFT